MPTRKKRLWWWISLIAAIALVIGSISSAIATMTATQAKHSVESLDVVRSATSEIEVSLPPASSEPSDAHEATSPATSPTETVSAFIRMLTELTVDDSPASHAGYDRDLFNIWVDADFDGCNTRAEVLMLETRVAVTTTGRCTVISGHWVSVYDNVSSELASEMDIDHFVPLNEAWKSGAYAWDSQTRTQFGNDVGYSASLVVVTASSNRSKSDSDPARWMPQRQEYFCDYAASWVGVKWRWGLSVDTVEKRVLESVLLSCSEVTVDLPERAIITLATATEPLNNPDSTVWDGTTDPDYGTCIVVRANGAGPYRQGIDPEYGWYRDGDKDGMVCE